MEPMIQLTEKGIRLAPDLDEMRESFASGHVIRLPGLLSREVVDRIEGRLGSEGWTEKIHPGIKKEIVLEDPKTLHTLHFLTNHPDFLEAIRRITGRAEIANFRGRIYRMVPGLEHYDSWHDDVHADEKRLIGMSINLGTRPYAGGLFEIKKWDAEEPFRAIANTIAGDAILFNLSLDLHHRVTPVEPGEPKTAFAGWFKARGGAYLPMLDRPSRI